LFLNLIFYSDREAAVMQSNSWLYHYYSVQSKLSLGLQFDSSRIPPNDYYAYQPQAIPPQMPTYPIHQVYEMQPMSNINHHHCDYSNIPLSPTSQTHMTEVIESKLNRKESVPVDYSQHQQEHLNRSSPNNEPEKKEHFKLKEKIKKSNETDNNGVDNKTIKKEDYGKTAKVSNKKYTFKRIESLHISDGNVELPVENQSSIITDNPNEHIVTVMDSENRDVHAVYLNSSIQNRSRISKTFSSSLPILPHPIESNEIEQWNPSPTWSDSNIQKVPDIMHQQLSPYLITTPPTPISASHPITHGGTFTFDWVQEQYVPTSDIRHLDERSNSESHNMSPQRCLHSRPPIMSTHHDDGRKEEGKFLKQIV
jgi:hypothetical protein